MVQTSCHYVKRKVDRQNIQVYQLITTAHPAGRQTVARPWKSRCRNYPHKMHIACRKFRIQSKDCRNFRQTARDGPPNPNCKIDRHRRPAPASDHGQIRDSLANPTWACTGCMPASGGTGRFRHGRLQIFKFFNSWKSRCLVRPRPQCR